MLGSSKFRIIVLTSVPHSDCFFSGIFSVRSYDVSKNSNKFTKIKGLPLFNFGQVVSL